MEMVLSCKREQHLKSSSPLSFLCPFVWSEGGVMCGNKRFPLSLRRARVASICVIIHIYIYIYVGIHMYCWEWFCLSARTKKVGTVSLRTSSYKVDCLRPEGVHAHTVLYVAWPFLSCGGSVVPNTRTSNCCVLQSYTVIPRRRTMALKLMQRLGNAQPRPKPCLLHWLAEVASLVQSIIAPAVTHRVLCPWLSC